MVKIIVYRIVAFVLDNWKRTIKIIVAIYFITMGLTIAAGSTGAGALPMLNLSLPGI